MSGIENADQLNDLASPAKGKKVTSSLKTIATERPTLILRPLAEISATRIRRAVEGIEPATFLTEQQKRDIFYNNAARFLRLEKK